MPKTWDNDGQQQQLLVPPRAAPRMSGCGWRLLGLVVFYITYLVLGALVFTRIEAPLELEMLHDLEVARLNFLHDHPCIEESELDHLLGSVVASSRRGVHLAPPGQPAVPNWSFGQAFFFSSTIITTIGYGEQSPLSGPGKLFCIVYTLLGIPLTLLLLATLVQRLMEPTDAFLMWLNSRLGHLYRPLHIRLLHLFLVIMVILLVFLLLPATTLYGLESTWNWLDSFYYCFISLTTVGLGDFIPGDEPGQPLRPLYKTVITVYLLVGLLGMMLVMSVYSSIPELDLTVYFRPGFPSEDPERQRLHSTSVSGSLYTQQGEEQPPNETLRVVRARSRRDDEAEWDETNAAQKD